MARRKGELIEGKSRRVPELPAGADPELFDPEQGAGALEPDPALAGLLAELGQSGADAKVVVHKIVMDRGVRKEQYLFECAHDEFTIQDVQQSYGEGDYRVRVYVRDPSGDTNYMPIRANKRIAIGAPRKVIQGSPVAPAASGAGLEGAIAAALERQAAMFREMLAPIVSGAGSRQTLLAEMEMMGRILKGSAPAAGGGIDLGMIGALLKLLQSAQPEKPLTEEDVGPNTLLVKALDIFKTAMEKKAADAPAALAPPADPHFSHVTGAMPANPLPIMSAPAPVAATPAAAVSTEDEMNLYLKLLVSAAAKAEDVETWAERVADMAPDSVIDRLDSPEWFAELCSLAPECAKYPEWFKSVRDRVIAILDAPAPPEQPKA